MNDNPVTPGSGKSATGRNRSSASASYSGRRRSIRTPGSIRRRIPVTPHALKALGKLATPGRRRKSLKFGRTTPRDELRLLSRVLAKENRKKKQEQEEKEAKERQRQREIEEQRMIEERAQEQEQEAATAEIEPELPPNDNNDHDNFDEIDPVEMDDLDLEVRRRAPDRLSLAGDMRLSEGFDFGNTSVASKKSDNFEIVMDDDEDEVIQEEKSTSRLMLNNDSFRIELDEDELDDNDDNEDMLPITMDDYDDRGLEDDQTLPLKQIKKKKGKASLKPETAVPRRIIKDLLKNITDQKIPPDTFEAIISASNDYFTQVSRDLNDYSEHAKRKTIDTSDVLQLMHQQRLTNDNLSAFTLAHRYLPAELLEKISKKKK